MSLSTKTLRLRIKDKHSTWLRSLAREVNQVFNFCNEVSMKAARPYVGVPKWLSGDDMQKLVAGATKGEDGLRIPSQTRQQVCEEYATRSKQFKKHRLNWRVRDPKSPKYSLGWLPFKKGAVAYQNGRGTGAMGIDLGLKECATVSDGLVLEGRWYREE